MSELGDALDEATVTPAELQDALDAVGSEKSCPGRLVVHLDRTIWFCTEENDGRVCAGYDLTHARGQMPCHLALEEGACAICGPGGDGG